MEKQTRYKLTGKILSPLSERQFLERMKDLKGFKDLKKHRPFVAFLFYFGVRVSEALKVTAQDIQVTDKFFSVDIGQRLKHSKKTPPLILRINRPYVHELVSLVQDLEPEERLFSFSRVTGWRIVRRSFNRYPHYFRLNRITDLFERGFTITQIKSWTGLTLQSLEYYVGVVDNLKMGKSL